MLAKPNFNLYEAVTGLVVNIDKYVSHLRVQSRDINAKLDDLDLALRNSQISFDEYRNELLPLVDILNSVDAYKKFSFVDMAKLQRMLETKDSI